MSRSTKPSRAHTGIGHVAASGRPIPGQVEAYLIRFLCTRESLRDSRNSGSLASEGRECDILQLVQGEGVTRKRHGRSQ